MGGGKLKQPKTIQRRKFKNKIALISWDPYEAILNTEELGGESAQDSAGTNRVMELLKELEVARKERDIDPVDGIKPGESKDITDEQNNKSPIGS